MASRQPPEDGGSNPTVNFHGEQRRNDTHRSTTDPEARLFKKSGGSESKLSYMAHVLMENRNGLVVDTRLTKSTGKAERESAWIMAWRVARASGASPWAATRTTTRSKWWRRYARSGDAARGAEPTRAALQRD